MPTPHNAPLLVIGTGIGGLFTALKCAEFTDVLLLAKTDAAEGATRYAQGGIASVWSEGDSFDYHHSDTLAAGAGLCHADIVDLCVHEGPERVRELVAWGVPFDADLHREGGHSARRILHADDHTGKSIEETLLARVREHPRIRMLEDMLAIDLVTEGKLIKSSNPGRVVGAYVLSIATGEVLSVAAQVTVLATGGVGKVFLYTSNPDVATGDGIAMAHRAGARVSNLEFMQFHPTCLYHPSRPTFLLTEALRGEGAVLRTATGKPMASMLSRDKVALSMDEEMKRTGAKHLWLDATSLGYDTLKRKFPTIWKVCSEVGVDPSVAPIPVVPAAHYMCGGVAVNFDGATSLRNLYAVGEVACTGLHGANRLASNSLLEAAVFADRIARSVRQVLPDIPPSEIALPQWNRGSAVPIEEEIDLAASWLEIRTLMWNYVGIVRSNQRLERARVRLSTLKSEIQKAYWEFQIHRNLVELRNLVTVADLIVQSAMWRKESRGLHFNRDYPYTDDVRFRKDSVF